MEADRHAPIFEKGEIIVGAAPEIVWDTLTDFRSWPQWMPGVRFVKIDEPVRVGTRFTWRAGASTIKSEIVDANKPQKVAWKGRTLGIDALHVWSVEPTGQGSRVVTEESWAGPLARGLRGLLRKTVRKAVDDGLAALKVEAERRARLRA
jgi:hypothetical protein